MLHDVPLRWIELLFAFDVLQNSIELKDDRIRDLFIEYHRILNGEAAHPGWGLLVLLSTTAKLKREYLKRRHITVDIDNTLLVLQWIGRLIHAAIFQTNPKRLRDISNMVVSEIIAVKIQNHVLTKHTHDMRNQYTEEIKTVAQSKQRILSQFKYNGTSVPTNSGLDELMQVFYQMV